MILIYFRLKEPLLNAYVFNQYNRKIGWNRPFTKELTNNFTYSDSKRTRIWLDPASLIAAKKNFPKYVSNPIRKENGDWGAFWESYKYYIFVWRQCLFWCGSKTQKKAYVIYEQSHSDAGKNCIITSNSCVRERI